ncbi:hypothetical protein FDUTEX481_09127 [Tolypothrix sp. PCC 7601]|nr:hypothetical protein FDUTEX481_09127 [Tolypothrix sp. PCC 7601]
MQHFRDFQKLNYSISKGEDIEQILSLPLLPCFLCSLCYPSDRIFF